MKNLITLAFIFLAILFINAQETVEKNILLNNDQEIFINFKFADDIKIEHWNKKEILIKAVVTIDDGKGNSYFSIKTSSEKNTLKIHSDFGNYFKQKRSKNKGNCNTTTQIDYTVFIPKHTTLKVKSISGNVIADMYYGNLTTDLISGDVTIKKYIGELQLKTISGNLDVVITNALVKAKTLTGTIYSNLNITLNSPTRKSSSHNKISGIVNKGGKLIRFETISGNIYLRRS